MDKPRAAAVDTPRVEAVARPVLITLKTAVVAKEAAAARVAAAAKPVLITPRLAVPTVVRLNLVEATAARAARVTVGML